MVPGTETPAQSGRPFNPTDGIERSPPGHPLHSHRYTSGDKGNIMDMPAILRGDSLTRLLQGAAAGAVATLIVGFYWGGWVTGGTAKDMVQRSTSSAVVTALSPICVDKFQHSAEASVNMVELKKVSSYQQGPFIEKGGWATLPGSDNANSSVARACAEMLSNLK
jgi:hypothetical protein